MPYRIEGQAKPYTAHSECAVISLLEARANQMVTETEWEALAQAVKEETGHYIQWRNWDELKPE